MINQEDKIGENLDDLDFGGDFLDPTLKAIHERKKELIKSTSLNLKINALQKTLCRE